MECHGMDNIGYSMCELYIDVWWMCIEIMCIGVDYMGYGHVFLGYKSDFRNSRLYTCHTDACQQLPWIVIRVFVWKVCMLHRQHMFCSFAVDIIWTGKWSNYARHPTKTRRESVLRWFPSGFLDEEPSCLHHLSVEVKSRWREQHGAGVGDSILFSSLSEQAGLEAGMGRVVVGPSVNKLLQLAYCIPYGVGAVASNTG